jgi:hypothetical protein
LAVLSLCALAFEHAWAPTADRPPANPLIKNDTESNQPIVKRTDSAATEPSQGDLDKAVLEVTLARLKSASDFKYASDPLAVARST